MAVVDDVPDVEDAPISETRRPTRAPAVRLRARACAEGAAEAASTGVPGTQRIYIKTYGCSHNQSDSEYMAGLLAEFGYELSANPLGAQLWLVNSCTVKGPSQDHLLNDVRAARAARVPIVVAGCVSQAHPELEALQGLSIVGVEQIDRVVEVVGFALQGHAVRLLARRTGAAASRAGVPLGLPSLALPKVRRNALVEVVPVNVGCLGACTYCKTVHARGRLTSYPLGALVERARAAVADGVRELWLTSEDTGAYGRDLGVDFPTMVRALVEQGIGAAAGEVRVRVGMANPPYMLEHLDAIADVLRMPGCYAFLHVPVQSGSDAVLGAMNREYTVDEFRHVADALLARVPELTLATDVICGFPGETDDDHEQTLALLREYRFPVVNISQFYPRPGTPAARMGARVPTHIVKARSREMSALFNSYLTWTALVGREVDVLVTDVSSDGRYVVAHTRGYAQFLLPPEWPRLRKPAKQRAAGGDGERDGDAPACAPAESPLMGCRVLARILSSGKFWVKGEVVRVISRRPAPRPAIGVSVAPRVPRAERAAAGSGGAREVGAREPSEDVARTGRSQAGECCGGGESGECCAAESNGTTATSAMRSARMAVARCWALATGRAAPSGGSATTRLVGAVVLVGAAAATLLVAVRTGHVHREVARLRRVKH